MTFVRCTRQHIFKEQTPLLEPNVPKVPVNQPATLQGAVTAIRGDLAISVLHADEKM